MAVVVVVVVLESGCGKIRALISPLWPFCGDRKPRFHHVVFVCPPTTGGVDQAGACRPNKADESEKVWSGKSNSSSSFDPSVAVYHYHRSFWFLLLLCDIIKREEREQKLEFEEAAI